MKIIFHSDDLGITAGATRHILSAWVAGALDGFSVIANGEAIDAVRRELEKHLERPARIAVHFNLTEQSPSAPARDVSMLLGPDGMFRHSFGSLFAKWLLSSQSDWSALLRQVEIECRAQISAIRAVSGGRGVQAIDGHNHVHMIPGIFSSVASAARHAFPASRFTWQTLSGIYCGHSGGSIWQNMHFCAGCPRAQFQRQPPMG